MLILRDVIKQHCAAHLFQLQLGDCGIGGSVQHVPRLAGVITALSHCTRYFKYNKDWPGFSLCPS